MRSTTGDDTTSMAGVMAVLGCSKGTASKLMNGRYDCKTTDLPQRYEALVKLVASVRTQAQAQRADELCLSCPREDCSGCRVADLHDGG